MALLALLCVGSAVSAIPETPALANVDGMGVSEKVKHHSEKGPVSHGSHPDLTEHYAHLQHQDPGHLAHLKAIKAHKSAAGDTIGRNARGQDHWAVHSRVLQGFPSAPMKLANKQRNPAHDRYDPA
jgi:hypothetical protein